jgi:hypothetical protein
MADISLGRRSALIRGPGVAAAVVERMRLRAAEMVVRYFILIMKVW